MNECIILIREEKGANTRYLKGGKSKARWWSGETAGLLSIRGTGGGILVLNRPIGGSVSTAAATL